MIFGYLCKIGKVKNKKKPARTLACFRYLVREQPNKETLSDLL
tara:strand:+ start:19593 stop:19721 length:129 start_codon:yes stop_codon:yes gene_type:complete